LQQAGVTRFGTGVALAIASSILVPNVEAIVAFYGVPNFVGFSD